MILSKIYSINGIELHVPITIVSTPEECYVQCISATGRVYMRHRRNYYTEEQWNYRCSTLVDSSNYGRGASEEGFGIPMCYYPLGNEGNIDKFLGRKSSEVEKLRSHLSHLKYHDIHKAQMKRNNAKYKLEKSK